VDPVLQRLGAGGRDRQQPVGHGGGEELHHLPVAVGGAAQPAAHLLDGAGQHPVLEGRAVAQRAPGLRASTGT
jgi:hypothetical protein